MDWPSVFVAGNQEHQNFRNLYLFRRNIIYTTKTKFFTEGNQNIHRNTDFIAIWSHFKNFVTLILWDFKIGKTGFYRFLLPMLKKKILRVQLFSKGFPKIWTISRSELDTQGHPLVRYVGHDKARWWGCRHPSYEKRDYQKIFSFLINSESIHIDNNVNEYFT